MLIGGEQSCDKKGEKSVIVYQTMADAASELRKQKLIANALNSAWGANIFDDGIEELIQEYFVDNSNDKEEEENDKNDDFDAE